MQEHTQLKKYRAGHGRVGMKFCARHWVAKAARCGGGLSVMLEHQVVVSVGMVIGRYLQHYLAHLFENEFIFFCCVLFFSFAFVSVLFHAKRFMH